MKEKKFEEALGELEQIVQEMELGELSLEESFKKFEKGNALAKVCAGKLTEVEKKVKVLKGISEEGPEWEDLT
ncbi:exodeoxyribonuclease VII small subunit [Lentisphaera profundi]|uniref:Exodeoxyribonuclease 7 small subunit n=1 Tax=Lentisphaera profundi TaxID=1658616 RepID=A0ABY7VRW2_9BACT|nr:exodeoxyribonuclease VII small subunit [Lentisphaera profundi]WDE96950.1 exodeoxyribonuclease VII small subunit [Lentisphaera profundi]